MDFILIVYIVYLFLYLLKNRVGEYNEINVLKMFFNVFNGIIL